jgi:mercuric ion transport protein
MNNSGGQRSAPAILNYLSLFTSFGTLLCCALPSLLVLLGLGATVASFLSALPFLVTLSQHKVWVFGISGVLIVFSFLNLYFLAPRLQRTNQTCAPGEESACIETSRLSKIVLWFAALIYAIGFFVAFVLGPILTRMDN